MSKPAEKRNKRVVIIDDNRELLEELKELLVIEGYDVKIFSDYAAAIKDIGNTIPDVILLDLKMPQKSGFEIAAELKEREELADIPVIAMSGYCQEYSALMTVYGFKNLLTKPINPDELVAEIEKVI